MRIKHRVDHLDRAPALIDVALGLAVIADCLDQVAASGDVAEQTRVAERDQARTAAAAVALIIVSSLLQLVGPLATAVALDPGQPIRLTIPLLGQSFQIDGSVAWCRKAGRGFDVGVRFERDCSAFVMRMAEQICYIEQYRRDVRLREGRQLTSDESAAEWITRFAARFPR